MYKYIVTLYLVIFIYNLQFRSVSQHKFLLYFLWKEKTLIPSLINLMLSDLDPGYFGIDAGGTRQLKVWQILCFNDKDIHI